MWPHHFDPYFGRRNTFWRFQRAPVKRGDSSHLMYVNSAGPRCGVILVRGATAFLAVWAEAHASSVAAGMGEGVNDGAGLCFRNQISRSVGRRR
jgi:hypothetical protein